MDDDLIDRAFRVLRLADSDWCEETGDPDGFTSDEYLRFQLVRLSLAGLLAAPVDDEAVKRLERKLDTLRAIAQGISSGADDMRKEIDNVTRALAALREEQR